MKRNRALGTPTAPGRSGRRVALIAATLLALYAFGTEAGSAQETPSPPSASSDPTVQTSTGEQLPKALVPIAIADLDALEPAVGEVIRLREEALKAAVASGDVEGIVDAYSELGYLYHAHSLWQQALACYANAENLAPQDPRWPYAAALAFRETGALDEAASAFERSLDLFSRNPAGLIGLAEVRLEQNQPVWAKDLLRHALEIVPESPSVLAVLGQVELSQEHYAAAAKVLERALSQQPEATRLHYPLGLAYRGLGDLDKAREHLAQRGDVGVRPTDPIRDAIEERKTGERVMLLEGRRAFAVGRFPEAIALFAKALAADPSSTTARVNLASAHAMAGDLDQAIKLYREILEIEPDNQASLFNLGLLLSQRGERQEALPLLERAAASDANDAEVQLHLAKTLAAEGQLEKAAEWADKATHTAPANQDTWLFAAKVNQALSRWAKARELLQEANRLMPDQGLIAHDLARLLAASPDAAERDGEWAVRLASRVAASAGTAVHLETWALALAESGRCLEAAEAERRALEATPSGARAEQMRQDLERYLAGPPCRPPMATTPQEASTTDGEG